MAIWTRPPSNLALAADEAHVWRVDLDGTGGGGDEFAQYLSEDERERAASFAANKQRRRFAMGRGVLRHLLARYTGTPPSSLIFAYGAHGKPCLAVPEHGIQFNVSHSMGVMLLAMVRDSQVGVDIQQQRSELQIESLLPHVLSPPEVDVWQSVALVERTTAFLRLWTAKEAYAKAEGRGVSLPFTQLDVSAALTYPNDTWHRVDVWQEEAAKWREDSRWKLKVLASGPNEFASLVVEDAVQRFSCWYYVLNA